MMAMARDKTPGPLLYAVWAQIEKPWVLWYHFFGIWIVNLIEELR